jgi:hypothetical protein
MVKFSYQLSTVVLRYTRWTALHWQINLTCDDMNIIQVAAVAAVSSYQQLRKCFVIITNIEHWRISAFTISPWCTSQFGLKLCNYIAGFILLEEEAAAQAYRAV